MTSVVPLDVALGASLTHAFMTVGLCEVGLERVTKYCGVPQIVVISNLSDYAFQVEILLSVMDPEFPACFEYHFSQVFGRRFANYIVEHGVVPCGWVADQMLIDVADEYFGQS